MVLIYLIASGRGLEARDLVKAISSDTLRQRTSFLNRFWAKRAAPSRNTATAILADDFWQFLDVDSFPF